MKKSDIEALLSIGEFRNLDFKASHELDKNAKIEITKDLLAFANIPDGGRIIIGVKENKGDSNGKRFELTGMEPEHLSAWTHDNLADTARNYADPYVEFELESVPVNERVCMVIKIREFEEIPVICKQQFGNTLKCGAIYTRSYGKRESAEVRSQTEVREILNLATEKNIRKFIGTAMKVGLPLILSPTDSDKFDKQLERFLTIEDDIREKIKSRGYWKIVIRPSKFAEKRIPSLKDCVDIIRDNKVLLRGWDYPHYDFSKGPLLSDNYVEQSFCWEEHGHIETWRYYQSGQFAHYLAVWEDWDKGFKNQHNIRDPKVLSLIPSIGLLTEIFEFASRLGTKGYLGDSCEIIITLHDTKDRSLISLEGFLSPNYVANLPEISYPVSLAVNDLIGNTDNHALDAAKHIFERFNWLSFDGNGFKPVQKKLRANEW